MKKKLKFLAAFLVLVLIVGTIPVQAASKDVSLKTTSKTLYLGGCKGTKANGTKAKFYSYVNVAKVLNNYNSKTMTIKLTTADKKICTVSNSKARITAKGRGTTKVTIKVIQNSTQKNLLKKNLEIVVNKNADKNFPVEGIKDSKEYKVGSSITVKMPNTKDDDFKKLTCSASGVTLKKTGTNGSEYKVTFKKAGTYTIKAVAYMNNTYKGTIAEKSFKVIVKGEEGKTTPTPTPEPTATPTATPEPTETPSELSVKQTALDTIVISGVDKAETIEEKDIDLYFKTAGLRNDNVGGIESVEASDGKITVKMFSMFEPEIEFFVNIKGRDGEPASFTSASYSTFDIVKLGITNNRVRAQKDVDLGIRYYNKNGVDITSGVKDQVIVTVKVKDDSIYDVITSGSSVYFYEAGKNYIFEISVFLGYDKDAIPRYYNQDVAVASTEPQSTGFKYTVKGENGVYINENDEESHSITKDTVNPVVEALYIYTDEEGNISYKTMSEEGVDDILISDQKILLKGPQSPTGGWGIVLNNTGTTKISFMKQGKVVGSGEITVLPEREPAKVSAILSKSNVNVNPIASDSISVKATVYDQYGKPMDGQVLTIEQDENTKVTTGVVTLGTFDSEGKLVIPGTSIVLNTEKKNDIIVATIKCNEISTNIQFRAADCSEAKTWFLASDPEQQNIKLDASIKPGSVSPEIVTFNIQGMDGAYTVKNEQIHFYPKQPAPTITAAELGVTVGDTVFIFAVKKDGKYLDTLPLLISDIMGDTLTFTGFASGTQLEAGRYEVQAFRVVAGADKSVIYNVTNYAKTVIVSDKQTPIRVKQIKDSSTSLNQLDIVKECFEFYLNGEKIDSSKITSAEVNIDYDKKAKVAIKAVISIDNTIYGSYLQEVDLLPYAVIHG